MLPSDLSMLLSLITPTHKPDFLPDVYRSLKLQTYTEWEWLLLPNGNQAEIPDEIRRDPRVRVLRGGEALHNIGAMKRFCCEAARGEVFVEMDHDDMLMPGASLQRVAEEISKGAGFVFSDVAVFRQRHVHEDLIQVSPFTYSAQHGWESYPVSVYGRELQATRSFEATPRSLCEIYYAPDHVRAWSRKAYREAGGHNPDLPVCDDHELIIKTYLSGSPFAYTGECHYLYRMYGHNTVKVRNNQIQQKTREFRETYLDPLIRSWASRHGYPTLDLSQLIRQGWRADRQLLQGFGENVYGHIIADTELQKLEGWQVREFMNEAWRALVPGGYLSVTVPEVHSGMGYGDVEWKSHFSATSMHPYIMKGAARDNGSVRCRFQQINCLEVYPSDWHRKHDYKFLRFEMAALKGDHRHPGLKHI